MAMLPPDPVYIFKGEMSSVSCVAFKINELSWSIYAGTQSGNVHVWDLKSKREMGCFKAGEDTCLSVCIPPEENFVITQTKTGHVSFWEEDNFQWVLKKLIKIDFFGFCKSQLFDNILYVPIKNSKFELISLKSMETVERIKLEGDNWGDVMAFKICCGNNKRIIIIAYEGLKLGLWDLNQWKKVSSLELAECPMAVDYDVITNKGLCGDPSDKILIFSLNNHSEFKIERKITLTNAGVASVKIRPDGKLVAVGCWDGKLRLYSWKNLVLLAVLDIHSSTVQDVSFSQNYREGLKVKYLLVAGSQDSKISLWDLYN